VDYIRHGANVLKLEGSRGSREASKVFCFRVITCGTTAQGFGAVVGGLESSRGTCDIYLLYTVLCKVQ
jgi:hypothetical protein